MKGGSQHSERGVLEEGRKVSGVQNVAHPEKFNIEFQQKVIWGISESAV